MIIGVLESLLNIGEYMHKKGGCFNYGTWLPEEKMKYLKYIPKDVITILDVGCGRGEWIWILKNKGFYVEGCDVDPICISKSKKVVKKVKYADVQELSKYYSNESFDFISCLHVLEHTYCPIDALKEMVKVTKNIFLSLFLTLDTSLIMNTILIFTVGIGKH